MDRTRISLRRLMTALALMGLVLSGTLVGATASSQSAQLGAGMLTSSCETRFGPNGSRDPALGYVEGSVAAAPEDSAAVYGPNGSRDPARGFIEGNTIIADVPDETAAVFGPNGSRDPALGYEAGSVSVAVTGVCMARR